MPGDHVAYLAAAGDGELEPRAEAMQRRATGTEQTHHPNGITHAERFVLVLGRLHGDVVAEPLGLFVGVGMAADVDEQRGIVDRRSFDLVEAEQLAETQRDQALTKDMFHRLPEPEIDAQRQRRDQLGQPNRRDLLGFAHARRVLPVSRGRSKDEVNASWRMHRRILMLMPTTVAGRQLASTRSAVMAKTIKATTP